ncbi:MAG: cupin domain-containing protein [Selenomonadaceae bacterium]|nr:cupin domain-containing protein [Selenomonadaceae bacterium]
MHLILLSGGSGKRLWPISNDLRSKQFIKIFKTEGGQYESMLQRVMRQLDRTNEDVPITVAASQAQETVLRKYLGDRADISSEPCRRNTFPSIALAVARLHDLNGVDRDEPIVVCPVDPFVDDQFFAKFSELADVISKGEASMVLMGIEPTYPSEKYGYIIPSGTDPLSDVVEFKEKPDTPTAQKYIEQGALWNGGVFAFKLGYLLDKAREKFGFSAHDELLENYASLPNISFDYAVVEQEASIKVVRYVGEWKDLGTWNTLTEVMETNFIGDVRADDSCRDVHVINELDVPIVCLGLNDIIASASPEGILITDRKHSSYIKPIVETIHQQIMFAEKSWGTYKVIDVERDSLTIKVTLNAGSRMKYHSHERRREVWNVIEGRGLIVIDGDVRSIQAGDVIELPIGSKHIVIADTVLKIIEVQFGREISVDDKIVHETRD